ncbi:MAG: peptidoglycan DD-metalloendopeptidase family protein [Rikenellaceae bacterium]|nr:peptidoglycan DD-metalloendopeptidase family protein [Rikenellaceae bacterium]
MKNALYFLTITLSVFLYGCGTSRQASRTPAPDLSPDGGIPTVILYPIGYEPGNNGIAEIGGGGYAEPVSYPEWSFSGLETEHVRVRGVNPLPESGLLEVDLDRLRDRFVYPYHGRFISDYGMRNGRPHTGVDIKAIPNDTIRAVLPGVVRMSKEYSSYGNIVVISHYCGFETVYAHCSRNLVRVNDRVEAGDPVGLAGRTGRATTEHLHFEVRVAGNPIDPKLLLDMENQSVRNGKIYAREHNGELVAHNNPADFEYIRGGTSSAPTDQMASNTPQQAGGQEIVRLERDTTPPSSTAAAQAQSQSPAVHVVVKGDTLSAIARRYSTTVRELCRLNGIQENGILSLGQRIRYR